jgi:hypothetical protein
VSRWQAVVICAALSTPLHAQTIPWTNAAGGNFNTIANWNSGAGPVPVAANTAQFNIANTYTTTFNLSPTNLNVTVGGSNVSFRADTVSSRTYTLTGSTSITSGSLTLAAPSSGSNTLALNIGNSLAVNSGTNLTVNSGNDISATSFNLAISGAGTATAGISGTGSSLSVSSASTLGQNAGVALLLIQNNATASFGNMTMVNSGVANSSAFVDVESGADITALGNLSMGSGIVAGQVSNFTVTGTGSTVTQTGSATTTIGAAANSSAILEVSSGGIFATGTGLTTVNATGQINIAGGTLSANGDITLNGGALTRGATGTFNWAPGKTMNVQAGGALNIAGNYVAPSTSTTNVSGTGSQMNTTSGNLSVNGGAIVNVTAGATLSADFFVDIAVVGNGSVLVDGAGSSIIAGAFGANLLGSTGTGTLTLSNNAAGNISGGYNIGGSSGSSGTLSVLSGATFTTGSLRLATSAATATGNVNVTGGTLIQTGSAILTVGASSLSSATLTVGTGGTFTTGNGLTTINPTGLVNISAGTLNANGSITINGGTLTQTSGAFVWAPAKTLTISNGGEANLGLFGVPTAAVISVSGPGSQLNTTSSIQFTSAATLTVQAGADVTSNNFIDIAGGPGDVTVLVDGLGSTLTATAAGPFNSLGTSGNAILTFSNNAAGNFPAGFLIGAIASSAGTLNVQSGATLASGNLQVGSSGADVAVANVNVAGGSITQSGSSALHIGITSVTDTLDTVTVSAGGSFTTGTGGTTVNTSGRLNINGGTFNANGNLDISGIATLTAGATLTVAPGRSTALNAGSTLNITDSTVNLGTLNQNGGIINFNSGFLSYTGNLTVGTGGVLGNSLTLDFSRTLSITGTTTINPQRQLALTGGSLTTASIANNGTFNFTSGTLTLAGPAGLTIGSGGSLGSSVTLGANQTLAVSNSTTLNAGTSLTLNGGAFSSASLTNSGTLNLASGSLTVSGATINQPTATMIVGDGLYNFAGGLTNSGEIKLAGGAARLIGGPITNAKLIRGDGRIDNNLTNTATGELRAEAGKTLLFTGTIATNAGRINLQGGTVQFTQPLTNGASGLITGTGFLYADSGLTNAGQLQLSAGFTSVYGNVTNNNKITITGGGTATFYDALVMSPGSTFQTSTNSTSVFFGPVTGTGAFTGPGVKNFEGGGPGSLLGTIATITGTTRVGPGTTVETGSFHEASVLIEGTLLLTPNLNTAQNTSRTSFLQIDPSGLLSLTDNNLIVDYASTSPIYTLISYLQAGQVTTNGDFNGLPTTVAIAESADLGLTDFNGIPVDDTTVIAKYTYVGDANLDGQVDSLDYERIDLAIGNSGALGTAQGDLNYDGNVDALDYEQVDLNIGNGVGSPLAAVFIPEPTALAPLALLPLLSTRLPRAKPRDRR